jgi:threonylcarbamoyladenosine tRNA methylthiotransferase CDKAL1
LDLIEKYKFRVVNINQFYLRPGTPAANLKQTPSTIVKSRSSKLTQLFKSYDHHGYMLNRVERVWIN